MGAIAVSGRLAGGSEEDSGGLEEESRVVASTNCGCVRVAAALSGSMAADLHCRE